MKSFLLLLCLCAGHSVFAQTKGIIIKMHPIDYLFDGRPSFDVEKQIAPRFSLEAGFKWKRKSWVTSPYDYRDLTFGETVKGKGWQVQLAAKWYFDEEHSLEGGYLGLLVKAKSFTTDDLTVFELDEFNAPFSYQVYYQMKGMGSGIILGRQFNLDKRVTMDFHCGFEVDHFRAKECLVDAILVSKEDFPDGVRKYKHTKPVVILGFTLGYRL